jgi:hypothetical protein
MALCYYESIVYCCYRRLNHNQSFYDWQTMSHCRCFLLQQYSLLPPTTRERWLCLTSTWSWYSRCITWYQRLISCWPFTYWWKKSSPLLRPSNLYLVDKGLWNELFQWFELLIIWYVCYLRHGHNSKYLLIFFIIS